MLEAAHEKMREEGMTSEVMNQLIGGGIGTATFYKPKSKGFERLC